MAQSSFIAVCLVSISALVACADAETDGVGNGPSSGGASGDGGSNQGGTQNQGAGPSDGGAPGTQTVTNNTVTNNTVTNGTVTSAGPTTTSGGGCMQDACLFQCIASGQLGQCVGGVCECMDGFPSGSSGSGFGGGFGFGGAFP